MYTYDLQKLQELLYDFYNLTGIKTSLHDSAEHELCFYPEKYSPFCKTLRENDELNERCRACDRHAFITCRQTKRRFAYTCHAGLTECFSPIIYNDEIIGYLVIGQFRTTSSQPFSALKDRFPPSMRDTLSKKYDALPVLAADKINSAIHILDACTGYEYLKKLVRSAEKKIDSALKSFIDENLQNDLSVSALCSNFHLSRSEIYSLFHEYFQSTVADFVKTRRLCKACDLLSDTDLPIAKIASRCGLPDYNYFSKQFRRTFGISPTAFRKKEQSTLH